MGKMFMMYWRESGRYMVSTTRNWWLTTPRSWGRRHLAAVRISVLTAAGTRQRSMVGSVTRTTLRISGSHP
jgi:hypothetical protein